jgi:hypothetical protein
MMNEVKQVCFSISYTSNTLEDSGDVSDITNAKEKHLVGLCAK